MLQIRTGPNHYVDSIDTACHREWRVSKIHSCAFPRMHTYLAQIYVQTKPHQNPLVESKQCETMRKEKEAMSKVHHTGGSVGICVSPVGLVLPGCLNRSRRMTQRTLLYFYSPSILGMMVPVDGIRSTISESITYMI